MLEAKRALGSQTIPSGLFPEINKKWTRIHPDITVTLLAPHPWVLTVEGATGFSQGPGVGHIHFPINEMGAVSTQLKEDVVFDLIMSLLGMYPKCCHGYTQMSVSTHPVEGAVPETGKQEAA